MSSETGIVYLDQNNIYHCYKKLDWAKLLEYIKEFYCVERATSYMAIDGELASQGKFCVYLANAGWKIEDVDIKQMSNVDSMILHSMISDSIVFNHKWIILISCDGDYNYTLRELSKQGFKIHVIGSKASMSLDLLKASDRITYLEEINNVILDK